MKEWHERKAECQDTGSSMDSLLLSILYNHRLKGGTECELMLYKYMLNRLKNLRYLANSILKL